MRGRFAVFLVLMVIGTVIAAGCIKGGNFVYSNEKTLPPGKSLSYAFSGPVNLTVKVSSNVPVEVRIAGDNGVLKDFGKIKKIDTVIELPKGKWNVIIRNPGDEKAVLDIELKGS